MTSTVLKCLTNNSKSYTIFTVPLVQNSLNCFTGTMWTGAEYTEFLESPILMAALATVHPFSFCYEQMK